MRTHHGYDFWAGLGFSPFGFRFWRPWGGGAWGFGFPRRGEYLAMLEEYKEYLEGMQRQLAEELDAVEREIAELKGRSREGDS